MGRWFFYLLPSKIFEEIFKTDQSSKATFSLLLHVLQLVIVPAHSVLMSTRCGSLPDVFHALLPRASFHNKCCDELFVCVLTHVLNTFENAEWKMQQLYGAVLLKTAKSCLFLILLDHTLSPKCSVLFTFKASEPLLHAPVFVHRQLWWAGGFNSLHTDHRCFKRAIHISQLTVDRDANPYSQPDTLPLVGRNSVHN